MRSTTLALTMLIALTCATAQASEWVSLGKSDNGKTETFIDVSSIRVTGEVRRAWIKNVNAPQTSKGVNPYPNKWVREMVGHFLFNCGEETNRVEAATVYYEDGTNGTGPAEISPSPWRPVAPDTVGSTNMQFICAWKQK
jgi:hypothetical protein